MKFLLFIGTALFRLSSHGQKTPDPTPNIKAMLFESVWRPQTNSHVKGSDLTSVDGITRIRFYPDSVIVNFNKKRLTGYWLFGGGIFYVEIGSGRRFVYSITQVGLPGMCLEKIGASKPRYCFAREPND